MKIWFGAYQEQSAIEEPAFIEMDLVEEVNTLVSNYSNWKLEMEQFLKLDTDFISYFEENIQTPKASWTTANLLSIGIPDKNLRHLPYLKQWMTDFPNIINCSISKLKGDSKILPHCGMTNAIYRCHIGIKVPSENVLECGIQVNDEQRPWSDGEALIFIDSNRHSVWNNTTEERIVLLFDVVRDEFVSQKKYISARLIVTYIIAKFLNKSMLKLFTYHWTKKGIHCISILAEPFVNYFISKKKLVK
jgi:hypothetical protein